MRGKPDEAAIALITLRYIPACAGETLTLARPLTWATVHPRVCGGNPRQAEMASISEGTSPRVRGKLEKPLKQAYKHMA